MWYILPKLTSTSAYRKSGKTFKNCNVRIRKIRSPVVNRAAEIRIFLIFAMSQFISKQNPEVIWLRDFFVCRRGIAKYT